MTVDVLVRDPYGNERFIIPQEAGYSHLEYCRSELREGWLTLTVDPKWVQVEKLGLDYRLEPWRKVYGYGKYLDGDAPFFLRKWEIGEDAAGVETLTLTAYDPLYFLKHRLIAYDTSDGKSVITSEPADDAMKTIISENLGGDATDTTRSIASLLSIEPDFSLCSNIYKEGSFKSVLDVLADICKEQQAAGVYLTFDIVSDGGAGLQFRTYKNQRGADRSDLIISQAHQNLLEPKLTYDYSDLSNAIYALGTGAGAARVIETALDTVSIGLSPWNRMEADVRSNSSDSDEVQADANAGLGVHAARVGLSGKVAETVGCKYGINYKYGDLLHAEYKTFSGSAHLDALHVTVDGGEAGKETVEAAFHSSRSVTENDDLFRRLRALEAAEA